MTSRKIRYGQLDDYLRSLGYDPKYAPTHVVYRKKGRKLPIILPRLSKSKAVPPSHLDAVKQILMLDGVVGAEEGPSLLSRKPLKRTTSKVNHSKVKAPRIKQS